MKVFKISFAISKQMYTFAVSYILRKARRLAK